MGVEPMSESSREEGVGGDDMNMMALLWNLLSIASFVLCNKNISKCCLLAYFMQLV